MESLPPPSENRGPLMLQVTWIAVGIATIFLAARIFTRIKTLGKLKLDDYLILLALAFGIVSAGLAPESVKSGFGKHIFYLGPEQISRAIKYGYIAQPFAQLALVFGRISFAVSLLSLIGTSKARRWILYGLITGQVLINLIFIGLELGQCIPAAKYWTPSLPGCCLSPYVLVYSGYVQGAWNIFTDFALAVMPGVVISNLHMRLGLKIGLIFLMCLGIVNMAAAIVTIVEISKVGSDADITYDTVTLDMWGILQIYLVITVTSIPFIRPLFRDWQIFSAAFYRTFLSKYAYRSRKLDETLHLESPRSKGYAIHQDDDSSPRLPHVARDRFVTTTLNNAGLDRTEEV